MATIYDVAAYAGVSPKTVSRVINGDAPVSDKTRSKVETDDCCFGLYPVFCGADYAVTPFRIGRSDYRRHFADRREYGRTRYAGYVLD